MTEKDLKKLNRYQLLEMLIAQTERADQLQAQLEEARQALVDKELKLSSMGSIAEASLHLTGVFQSAQEAADLYVNSAKQFAKDIESAAYEEAASILARAQTQARSIRDEARLDGNSDEETEQSGSPAAESAEERAEAGAV